MRPPITDRTQIARRALQRAVLGVDNSVHGTGLSFTDIGSESEYVQVFTARLHAHRAGRRHRHPRHPGRVRGPALRAPRPAGSYRLRARMEGTLRSAARWRARMWLAAGTNPAQREHGRRQRRRSRPATRPPTAARHRQHARRGNRRRRTTPGRYTATVVNANHDSVPAERRDRPDAVLRAATPGTARSVGPTITRRRPADSTATQDSTMKAPGCLI